MLILGFSCFYHDSGACLLKDGEIIAAVQEERFTRIKHDSNFPTQSIRYCLKLLNLDIAQIDYIVFYDKPFLKFERILETYFAFAPKGFKNFLTSMPIWVKDKLFQKRTLINEFKKYTNESLDWNKKLLFSEHHLSHAASAFFPSPFKSAAVLTMDGVGEWTTTSIAVGNSNKLNIIKEIIYPHSLGLLYSAFTYFIGFKVNSGEYKLMGLAPYGTPKYAKIITDNLINIFEDGSFQLNIEFFDFCTGLTMTNSKFASLFNRSARKPESPITQSDMDIAASIQHVTEEIILKIAVSIKKETGEENLCLAGGVALNCVANGRLSREKIFKNIWVQPASGDAGGALGAAYAVYYMMLNNARKIEGNKDSMQGSFLGPEYSKNTISSELDAVGAVYKMHSSADITNKTAKALTEGKAIGWMSGRMEFGPRSLGSRSIIADARSKKMQKLLNLKVKYRESFRPFAPSVLIEKVHEWFDIDCNSPYMLLVGHVKKKHIIKMTKVEESFFGIDKLNTARSKIPSVTHVDYSARIQTVCKSTNPKYHALIEKFEELTDCPVVINTSFNIRGEPIVCSPTDAYRCFMGTDLDVLVIDNFYLIKEKQAKKKKLDYKNKFQLD
jgi:carbamoyltransferase